MSKLRVSWFSICKEDWCMAKCLDMVIALQKQRCSCPKFCIPSLSITVYNLWLENERTETSKYFMIYIPKWKILWMSFQMKDTTNTLLCSSLLYEPNKFYSALCYHYTRWSISVRSILELIYIYINWFKNQPM